MIHSVACFVLISALFGYAAAGNSSNSSDGANITLTPAAPGVMETTSFSFTCDSNVSLSKMTLYVDGSTNGKKNKRITLTKHSSMSYGYVFADTTDEDNGTMFMCEGFVGNASYNSSVFTMQVYYPPRLDKGNNVTKLIELSDEPDEPNVLSVKVLDANPPVERFNITPHSENVTGVIFRTSNSSGNITFPDSLPDNRGNYTFTATNKIGTTSFTYRTYFGGPPTELFITCNPSYGDKEAVIECSATDHSDAPAVGVYVSLTNLVEMYFPFETIPAVDFPIPVLPDMSLYDIPPGNYSLSITGVNLIENITSFHEIYYIPGLHCAIYINTTNNTAIEGGNFTFMCSTPSELKEYTTNFTVLINNEVVTPGSRLVAEGKTVNGSQAYTYSGILYTENGLVFSCMANETETHSLKSPDLGLNVLYTPKYFNILDSTLVSGSPGIISINMSANPEPSSVQWFYEGKRLNTDSRIKANASSLSFEPVDMSDIGRYAVRARNTVGLSKFFNVTPEVLYAPHFGDNSDIPELEAGHDLVLTLNVTANPPINHSLWSIDGRPLVNSTGRYSFSHSSLNITGLKHTDDRSMIQLNVSNSIGSNVFSFNLSVLYGPIVTFSKKMIYTYPQAQVMLSANIQSNPECDTVWFHNGDILKSDKDITVNTDSVEFKSISSQYNGSYTVKANNSLGTDQSDTSLGICFGPTFTEHTTNSTYWIEYETSSTFTLTCTVNSSFPVVNNMFINESCHNETNCKIKTDNKTYITLTVQNAAEKNGRNYTCIGGTGHTSGYILFQTFVGGPPQNTTVKVNMKQNGGNFDFSMTVSDSSPAPPRTITFLNPMTEKNESFSIPRPLYNQTYTNDSFVSISVDNLQSGEIYIPIYASNNLGTVLVKNYSIPYSPTSSPTSGPTSAHKKSKSGAIAAGIAVPLGVIIIVIIIIAGVYYYMRKKKNRGFFRLRQSANDDATASTYGTTNS